MANEMFKTIPLDAAMEYYADAASRGRLAGKQLEYMRILELLKKQGMYEAIVAIKRESNGKTS